MSQYRRFPSRRQDTIVNPGRPRPHPAVVFACQGLEARRLLADISGIVFHDVDADRVRDDGEALQQGFNVYVDLNDNGVRDAAEPFATSDATGQWQISGLAAGTYSVRLEQRPGFTRFPTVPQGGLYRLNLAADSSVGNLDFGAVRYASASGQVFLDADGDGARDAGESGLANVTVFVDANRNGVLDVGEFSKQTDAEGRYRFDFLYPGFNVIRVVPTSGLRPSSPIQRAGSLPSGYHARDLNFGLSVPGSISGHVFGDADGDGVQAPLENDSVGVIVFLDLNNNGQFDGNDVGTRTNAQGNYAFAGLGPGTYTVRTVIGPATQITTPLSGSRTVTVAPGQHVTGQDFGVAPFGRIRGYIFADNNANGIEDIGEDRLAGRQVFIDFPDAEGRLNGVLDPGEPTTFTNFNGEYLFAALPSGRYAISVVQPHNQLLTAPPAGRHFVQVLPGQLVPDINFGLALAGEIRGRVFNDRNGNGLFDSDENGIGGRRVYADINNNGVFDAGDIGTVTGPAGVYSLPRLREGTYVIRTLDIPGATLTTPSGGAHVVPIVGGAFINNRNFGFALTGEIRGTVFNDINANGVRGPGDTPRAGVVVFADLNRNGVNDAGDISATTDASGGYALPGLPAGPVTIRIETPAGHRISVPEGDTYNAIVLGGERHAGFVFGLYQPASISGTVFNDLDQDGVFDGGEPGQSGQTVFLDLDNNGERSAFEPSQITDATGAYAFTDLDPGVYTVRIQTTPGASVTTPPGGAHSFIIVLSGDNETGRNFGVVLPASISGTVFNDLNANGVQDLGELGLAGRTVYIDANNNDIFEPVTEQSVTTAANGGYEFAPLPPGAYTIRVVTLPDDIIAAPLAEEYSIVLASSQQSINNDFAITRLATISGIVYTDNDGDGTRDAGDPPRSGITVFVDINENGINDDGMAVSTDATGAYSFQVLPGTYDVRIEVPGGEVVTEAPGGFYDDLTVTGGQQASGRNFGLTPQTFQATVNGLVFDDVNADGALDGGDVPLPSITIFADFDDDGVPDADEPTTQSNAVTGVYSLVVPLTGPVMNNVPIRALIGPDDVVTFPAAGFHTLNLTDGGVFANTDFGIDVSD